MLSHLEFIKQYLDNSDRTQFTDLEYLKFKRVVDYMDATSYEEDKLVIARKNFYAWFLEHDKRRNTNLIERFPEMKSFWNICKDQ
jgi:hypothetical protein